MFALPRPAFIAAAAIVLAGAASSAMAEVELGFYGGVQGANDSTVSIHRDSTLADREFAAAWDGKSLSMPLYWGVRATWWRDDNIGVGVDFTHNKIHADGQTLTDAGLNTLGFNDGLNILTLNIYKRWPQAFSFGTPYIGGGLGIAVPRVEVAGAGSNTADYQVTGPAATWMAGLSYPIADNWSLFGEYKGTYSMNTTDLNTGGTLETNVVTNAVNIGVTFNF
ncbi:Lipid A oxidase (Involved in formation of 2-aminogluconate) protein [Ketogulonicigenium robustum]|uniref:Lipid A oxidase (Involved in formation of 2-aminogluconate) protein n=1 Tax=Ketogulonicigenium robustum TaxID=92947 RepID=A0A1W6P336_9RHOB|nr:outer membrane beta-barrel protein [Ketogulonicigenium robustum]ARO15760.1 Lipid A oxidase (Involved in formation of 2-aminogluconate) protein [Ketogulonicigenium robustum]